MTMRDFLSTEAGIQKAPIEWAYPVLTERDTPVSRLFKTPYRLKFTEHGACPVVVSTISRRSVVAAAQVLNTSQGMPSRKRAFMKLTNTRTFSGR